MKLKRLLSQILTFAANPHTASSCFSAYKNFLQKRSYCILIFFLFLPCCSSYRESMGTYILPTTNVGEITREGRACYYTGSLKFWFSKIDFTVDAARRDGKIRNIIAIERETSGNWFLYKRCIIVRGN